MSRQPVFVHVPAWRQRRLLYHPLTFRASACPTNVPGSASLHCRHMDFRQTHVPVATLLWYLSVMRSLYRIPCSSSTTAFLAKAFLSAASSPLPAWLDFFCTAAGLPGLPTTSSDRSSTPMSPSFSSSLPLTLSAGVEESASLPALRAASDALTAYVPKSEMSVVPNCSDTPSKQLYPMECSGVSTASRRSPGDQLSNPRGIAQLTVPSGLPGERRHAKRRSQCCCHVRRGGRAFRARREH